MKKKKLSKTDLPFKFCKTRLRKTLFIFGRKWSFKIEALIELRKMLLRKNSSMYSFGIAQPLRYIPRFCRFTGGPF